jgi:hypothetical protein
MLITPDMAALIFVAGRLVAARATAPGLSTSDCLPDRWWRRAGRKARPVPGARLLTTCPPVRPTTEDRSGSELSLRSDGSMLREPSVTGESSQRITPHPLGLETSVPPPAHVLEAVVVIGD